MRHLRFLPLFLFSIKKVRENVSSYKHSLEEFFTFVRMSFVGVFLYLLDFPFIEKWFGRIGKVVLVFVVGLLVTHLPYYVLVIVAFLPPQYIGPLYFLSFLYMFLI